MFAEVRPAVPEKSLGLPSEPFETQFSEVAGAISGFQGVFSSPLTR